MKEPRAYFINYVAPMIKNYLNCSTCDDLKCSKIKVWTTPYKNTKRTKLLYSNDLHSYKDNITTTEYEDKFTSKGIKINYFDASKN